MERRGLTAERRSGWHLPRDLRNPLVHLTDPGHTAHVLAPVRPSPPPLRDGIHSAMAFAGTTIERMLGGLSRPPSPCPLDTARGQRALPCRASVPPLRADRIDLFLRELDPRPPHVVAPCRLPSGRGPRRRALHALRGSLLASVRGHRSTECTHRAAARATRARALPRSSRTCSRMAPKTQASRAARRLLRRRPEELERGARSSRRVRGLAHGRRARGGLCWT